MDVQEVVGETAQSMTGRKPRRAPSFRGGTHPPWNHCWQEGNEGSEYPRPCLLCPRLSCGHSHWPDFIGGCRGQPPRAQSGWKSGTRAGRAFPGPELHFLTTRFSALCLILLEWNLHGARDLGLVGCMSPVPRAVPGTS